MVHIDRHAHQFLELLEYLHPSVDVAGAVVAVYHSHERTVWSGHHVNHLVRLGEFFLQHNH